MLEWVAVSLIALGALAYAISRLRANRHPDDGAGCPGCGSCEQTAPKQARK